jgi:hypothetical protein
MKLHIMTLALDALPYIKLQLEQYEKLTIPWQWVIVHGVASKSQCTSWVRGIPGRLSEDGTTEWLRSISRHPNIRILEKPLWDGKREMCNAALKLMKESGVLLQADADEIHSAANLEAMVKHFDASPRIGAIRFPCRYYVGPNLITRGEDCYGANPGEWLRAWRYSPGDYWVSHEPANLHQRRVGRIMTRDEARQKGWVFDHYSYADEKTVAFKEAYYGYRGALESWRAMQQNKVWPAKLNQFFYWADDKAEVVPYTP